MEEGFYWIQIDQENPEIASWDPAAGWWWTTGWDVPIKPSDPITIKVLSPKLTYNPAEEK